MKQLETNQEFYESRFQTMRLSKVVALFFLTVFLITACSEAPTKKSFNSANMKIRIAELTIDTAYVEEYKAILKEEAEASVRLEEGVLCIFPMYQQKQPTEIRLLEIYADEAAYQAHLKTPHFLHYKTTTQKMVKSLKLIDMTAIDKQTMEEIFSKLNKL